MNLLILFFIIIQIVLLCILALHDWIHLPPLTNIRELEKHHSVSERIITSIINASTVLVPLVLTIYYQPHFSRWIVINILIFYSMLMIGTICSWWIPYLCGSSEKHKKAFAEYHDTHHFLPARGDNVIPNTFHVFFVHIPTWICLIVAVYLLVS